MTYSFNLIDNPWIPCVMPGGETEELSLRDTLGRAHEINSVFDQSPLATASLHRLLLAILHRNFGPASRAEWKDLWRAGRFDVAKLDAYFIRWKNRFDLFDEKYPFYQVAEFHSKNKIIAINEILTELPKQHTPVLFDHTTYDASPLLSPQEAARTLISIQAYKLAGTFVPPGLSYTDAPIARPAYFLVVGRTLFETLMLNLVRYYDNDPVPVIGGDLPVWERDEPMTSPTPQGYLDYLTWQTLRLRLLPQTAPGGGVEVTKIQIALGRNFKPAAPLLDPGCIYHKNPKAKSSQEPWLPLRYNQDKALWRDSGVIFRLSSSPMQHLSSIRWVAKLVDSGILPIGIQYRLSAYGLCSDQQKIFLWRREYLPLPVRYLTDEKLVENLGIVLGRAEAGANALSRAVVHLARCILYPSREEGNIAKAQIKEAGRFARHLAATEQYWSSLEIPFLALVQVLPEDPDTALPGWMKTIRTTALNAFDETTRDLDHSARVLQAVVSSRDLLAGALSRALQSQS